MEAGPFQEEIRGSFFSLHSRNGDFKIQMSLISLSLQSLASFLNTALLGEIL
jgi:hypothetical protein